MRSLGPIPLFFRGPAVAISTTGEKSDRPFSVSLFVSLFFSLSSLLYLPVARYCDLGATVSVRLQAHPSYSAETLPFGEKCATYHGPGL